LNDQTFNSIGMTGVLGYSWEHVALDFTLSLRVIGDYADFIGR